MTVCSVYVSCFQFVSVWDQRGGEREEGDITREITGLLCQLENCQQNLPLGGTVARTSHTSLFTQNWGGLCGPALFKHSQTGIMSILLEKTMDKISNLCLGRHKNKWKLGISPVLEYVLYPSQVQYNCFPSLKPRDNTEATWTWTWTSLFLLSSSPLIKAKSAVWSLW